MENCSLAVVGVGALGNEVIKSLGLIGAGRVIVIDPDRIEASNLTRSVFYSYYNSAGEKKADVIAQVCGRLFPNTHFESMPVEVADVGFQDLKKVDLVFSCVDSDSARVEIAYMATRLDLPVADAGLGADNYAHGRVTWFGGRGAACFGCMLSREARREILAFNAVAPHSCWAPSPSDAAGLPGTPMMSAVIAGMQVDLGLRALADGRRDESWSVEISLDAEPRMDRFVLRQSVSCPFHDPAPQLVGPPADGAAAWDLLGAIEGNDPVLVLDWPVCSAAACADCGHKWSPLVRLALFRRAGVCPECGSRNVRDEETIRSLPRHSSWAAKPLESLGLPPRHLYTVRTGDTQ